MNAIFKSIFLAAAILLLGAGSAMATTVTFGDDANTFQGWVPGNFYQNSQDVIGIPNFTGGSATFTQTGSTTTLTSVTFHLRVNQYETLYNALTSGDLFINANGDSSWDYVVDLASSTPGAGSSSANVYAFNYAYTASYVDGDVYDLSNSVYTGSSNIRNGHPVNAASSLDLGSSLGTASFTGLPDWPEGGTTAITISGLDLAVGDYITLGYTVSCANDVIFQTVRTPIPGAVWLLGSGLLGLVGLRSRFRG